METKYYYLSGTVKDETFGVFIPDIDGSFDLQFISQQISKTLEFFFDDSFKGHWTWTPAHILSINRISEAEYKSNVWLSAITQYFWSKESLPMLETKASASRWFSETVVQAIKENKLETKYNQLLALGFYTRLREPLEEERKYGKP